MRANFSSAVSPAMSELMTIAPALIIGLNGRPAAGSRLIALNGSPLGSTPTCLTTSCEARLLEREGEHERLRDRLDRERRLAVADLVHRAADADERDAERLGIGVGQLGDVGRELAVGVRSRDLEHRVERRTDRIPQVGNGGLVRFVVGHGASLGRGLDAGERRATKGKDVRGTNGPRRRRRRRERGELVHRNRRRNATRASRNTMGVLIYNRGDPIEIDDRALAHLQVVIIDKLRRGEHFALTLEDDRRVLTSWISPRTAIEFIYRGNRKPSLNHAWLEDLAGQAGISGVLTLVPEPAARGAELALRTTEQGSARVPVRPSRRSERSTSRAATLLMPELVRPRVAADQVERLLDRHAVRVRHDALRLLDDDPTAQRGLQLLGEHRGLPQRALVQDADRRDIREGPRRDLVLVVEFARRGLGAGSACRSCSRGAAAAPRAPSGSPSASALSRKRAHSTGLAAMSGTDTTSPVRKLSMHGPASALSWMSSTRRLASLVDATTSSSPSVPASRMAAAVVSSRSRQVSTSNCSRSTTS